MKESPSMTDAIGSFPLPDMLEPDLNRVHAYWQGLKRGENDIPFWDDVKFSLRTRLAREALLIEVFENPQRFRFDIVGEDVTKRYGKAINGKFSDEIDLSMPLEELTRQCRATVERRIPTYYRQAPSRTPHEKDEYARLVLPLWGNGRIEMLLAAIARTLS
jgi:hypothetical protein